MLYRLKLISLLMISFGTSLSAWSQKQAIKLDLEAGLRVRWQSGNLNQLAVNPSLRLTLASPQWQLSSQASYQYLQVEGFAILNDFWTYSELAYQPEKRIFPIGSVRYGFARSYQIENSLHTGPGLAWNLIQQSPQKFVRLSLIGGYLHFAYIGEPSHQSFALGSVLAASFPLGERLQIRLEGSSYHSLMALNYWGLSQSLGLIADLGKGFSLSINQNLIYNHQVVESIQNTNSLLMLGFQYRINSSKK